jgi:CheY-like chemotaxis protein
VRTPLRVLVVDDEMLLRWSVAEALRSCGHTVIEASDAVAATRALAHGGIDAVLIDYWSAEHDNFRLLEMVGALAPAAAVVLMTASAIEGLEEQARALGAAALVHKPFDVFGIEPVLWRACQGGRAAVAKLLEAAASGQSHPRSECVHELDQATAPLTAEPSRRITVPTWNFVRQA